jgi:hypothetical protein
MNVYNKGTCTYMVVHSDSFGGVFTYSTGSHNLIPNMANFFNHYIYNGFESYKWLIFYPL